MSLRQSCRAGIVGLALLAAGCSSDEAPVAPAAAPSVQRLTSTAFSESAPTFSPDGTRIVYERENEIWILDLASRSTEQVAPRGNHPTWSADGAAILFVRRDLDGGGPLHRLVRLELAGGALDTLSADSVDVYEPAAAPSGGAIAYRALSRTTYQQGLVVVSAEGARRATLTRAGRGVDVSPAWSADGLRIAYVHYDDTGGSLLYWVPADGDDDPALLASTRGAADPAWHPDGRIVHALDGRLVAQRLTGGAAVPLVRGTGFARDPAISADGRQLVFATDRSGNFDLWLLTVPAGIGEGPYSY